MDYQQALFVKNLLNVNTDLNNLAKVYFRKYGETELCYGPADARDDRDYFSALDGNDIRNAAESILHEKLGAKY